MEPIQVVRIACVVAFTATAAMIDLRIKKLPNVLTVAGFAAAIVFWVAAGLWEAGLPGAGRNLIFSLLGFAVGFGILWVLWMLGGSGGGDVKFMGALGAWLGAKPILAVLIVSALVSLCLTFGALTYQFVRLGPGGARRRFLSRKRPDKKNTSDDKAEAARQQWMVRRRLIPYGVPVALATWIVLAAQVTGLLSWVLK